MNVRSDGACMVALFVKSTREWQFHPIDPFFGHEKGEWQIGVSTILTIDSYSSHYVEQ
jgi:hypothetical protein